MISDLQWALSAEQSHKKQKRAFVIANSKLEPIIIQPKLSVFILFYNIAKKAWLTFGNLLSSKSVPKIPNVGFKILKIC